MEKQIKLNENEKAVLKAVYAEAEGNGFDFGYSDVKVRGLTAHQVAGYISQLVQKKLIVIDDEFGQVAPAEIDFQFSGTNCKPAWDNLLALTAD